MFTILKINVQHAQCKTLHLCMKSHLQCIISMIVDRRKVFP